MCWKSSGSPEEKKVIGLEDLPARVPQITATEAKWETGRADGNDVVTWENSPFLSGASFVLRLRSRLQLRRLSLPPRPSVSDAKQPLNSQLPFTLQPFPLFFLFFFFLLDCTHKAPLTPAAERLPWQWLS